MDYTMNAHKRNSLDEVIRSISLFVDENAQVEAREWSKALGKAWTVVVHDVNGPTGDRYRDGADW